MAVSKGNTELIVPCSLKVFLQLPFREAARDMTERPRSLQLESHDQLANFSSGCEGDGHSKRCSLFRLTLV